ncbi:2-octaprenyl-6-methoxyphenol hydroxylase [Formivibrio citricus]|uniref:2-octaprenyl-6-methoxyphenol hydroxylase n=1 Tax=Formivibrio citricus TaxID=83765 RepID=A0A1I5CCJ2_9NEIS|nr:FAD-dependent monooxygenase [Formivibrio citricus]SFN84667.1 2-octaprenyl-6-methoxyphenol hydroxylase [Formivibrio citricus]
MRTPNLPLHVDVLIVGGGPVGALLAQRLAKTQLSVLVAEARTEPADDPRALALSWSSRQILGEAGLWDAGLQPTAIERVHVSQQGTLGRVELAAEEIGLPELGCVVPYAKLAGLARERLATTPGLLAPGTEVAALDLLDGYAVATLRQAEFEHTLTARLVVLADGGGLAATLPGLAPRCKPYRQHALLAMLTPEAAHRNTAWERFATDGPLALLPCGEQLALVWAQEPEQAERRLALGDADFLSELNTRLGQRTPKMTAVGPRTSFALALKTVDNVTGKRLVMIGNAAQTLHPIAGQGLNLGLRDADTLAQLLANSPRAELGSPAQLARYTHLRHRDADLVTGFTDGLVELFRPDFAPLRHARSLGLLALDLIGPARRELAQMMVFGLR